MSVYVCIQWQDGSHVSCGCAEAEEVETIERKRRDVEKSTEAVGHGRRRGGKKKLKKEHIYYIDCVNIRKYSKKDVDVYSGCSK